MKNKQKVILTVSAALIFIMLYFSGVLGFRISFGFKAINTEKEWRATFQYLSGKINGRLHMTANDSVIIISSELDKGSLDFYIYLNDNLIGNFKSDNTSDTILIKRDNAACRIQTIAKGAKGSFNIKVE